RPPAGGSAPRFAPRVDALERPRRVPAQQRIVARGVRGDRVPQLRPAADVAGRDERVPLQPATVVSRDVEAVVACGERVLLCLEPLDERDVRLGFGRRRTAGAALLDAAVPRTDVLADVAAVHLRAEPVAVFGRDGLRGLRPVREALARVERAELVERAGRAGVHAEPAGAAVELEPG